MAKSQGPVAKLRHKLKTQNARYARGGYKRGAENGDDGDKRNGGYYHVPPAKVVPSYDLNAKAVERLQPGHASGLYSGSPKYARGGCGKRSEMRGRGVAVHNYDFSDYIERRDYAEWPLFVAERVK